MILEIILMTIILTKRLKKLNMQINNKKINIKFEEKNGLFFGFRPTINGHFAKCPNFGIHLQYIYSSYLDNMIIKYKSY